MSGDRFVVNSKQSLDFYINFVTKQFEDSGYTTYSYVKGMQRTSVESNALHKYCGMLAKALNDSGLDMRMVKDDVDLPWSKETVKEFLWKPIQLAVTGEESTTNVKMGDYSKVYDVLNKHLSTNKGIQVFWPCKGERTQ
jgi:hypothetical protein